MCERELRCGGEVVPPDLPVLPPEPVKDRFREIWGTRNGYREADPVPGRKGFKGVERSGPGGVVPPGASISARKQLKRVASIRKEIRVL